MTPPLPLNAKQLQFLADFAQWQADQPEEPVGHMAPFAGNTKDFVIIDFETTGPNADTSKGEVDRVVSISVRLCDAAGEEKEEFHSLVNPERPIPADAAAVHGIKDDDVVNAPKFADVAAKILSMTKGAIFTAYNSWFDRKILENELGRLGLMSEHVGEADLLAAYYILEPDLETHTLESWAERYAIPFDAHDAHEDTRISRLFLQQVLAGGWAPETAALNRNAFIRHRQKMDPEFASKPASEPSIRFVFVKAREAGWVDEDGYVQSERVEHLCQSLNRCKTNEMTALQQRQLVDIFEYMAYLKNQ